MFLKGLYGLFRILVKTTFPLFYRQLKVLDKERLVLPNGGIVASNHPSTLLDPLNAVAWFPFQVKFLANYGLFTTPFTNWLFRTLYSIPVQRREDVGMGKALNNLEAFSASNDHLAQGGQLFMAPEGTCATFRHVLPIKSGIARILLAAEASKDFKLDISVFPMGLCYWHPYDYRSRLLIRPGQPIPIKQYAELYQKDASAAQRQLIQDVQKQLRELTIYTQSPKEDQLIHILEGFVHAPKRSVQVPLETQWEVAKKLQLAVQAMATEAPEQYNTLLKKASIWANISDKSGVNPCNALATKATLAVRKWWGLVPALLLLPVMLLTLFPQGLVARLPIWVKTDLSYYPTFRFAGNVILLGFFWLSLAMLLPGYLGIQMTLIVMGIIALAQLVRSPLYSYWHDFTLPAWKKWFFEKQQPGKAQSFNGLSKDLSDTAQTLLAQKSITLTQ